MPARSTMLTGQYVRNARRDRERRAVARGRPSVAAHLQANGYHTVLLGKAHFEPGFDFNLEYAENFMSERGLVGPYRASTMPNWRCTCRRR